MKELVETYRDGLLSDLEHIKAQLELIERYMKGDQTVAPLFDYSDTRMVTIGDEVVSKYGDVCVIEEIQYH